MDLMRYSPKSYLFVFILIAFAALTSLHLHGYSIPMWRTCIDVSPPDEVVYGKPRSIRSDDWVVFIPYILSQVSHNPPFPIVNKNIGSKQNMLILSVPVLHWATIFRPQIWGFFKGGDFGLSWNWWFNMFGLFYVFFLVFMIISRDQFYLSLFASITFLFSPFVQFWSLNQASLCIFMGLSFIFATRVINSKGIKQCLFYALLLGWSGVAYILVFYPPYQITLGYLSMALK